jgi:hypothetical protein
MGTSGLLIGPRAFRTVVCSGVAIALVVTALIGLVLLHGPGRVSPPPRPASVPSDAVWAGGASGGVFIRCLPVPGDSALLRCEIFNDFTGDRWARGLFRLAAGGRIDFDPADARSYGAFDGAEITLSDGRTLWAVEPPRPPSVPGGAVWLGGARCGAFVDCRKEDASARHLCAIYDELSGELVSRGAYYLRVESVPVALEPYGRRARTLNSSNSRAGACSFGSTKTEANWPSSLAYERRCNRR